MESGNRRLTLFEHMSVVDNGRDTRVGLTLDAILGNAKRPEQPPTQNRTLLEIIRDDGSNKDKKSWKTFRDKLRLKSAWTSSVHIPAFDVNVNSNRSQLSRCGSFRSNSAGSTRVEDGGERAPVSDPSVVNSRLQLARRGSVRFGHNQVQADHDDSADVSMPSDAPPSRSFRPQITRHLSTRFPSSNISENDDSPVARDERRQLGAALAEERAISAREAAAAQGAAEGSAATAAFAAEQAAATENNTPPTGAAEEPVRMSLMDLLEETDQQMGLTGSRYTMGDEDYEYKEIAEASGRIEYTCCVCMVRHKGAAFIPCGHTFCRLCSRELWVQRGNCPLCNGIIQEILDIF